MILKISITRCCRRPARPVRQRRLRPQPIPQGAQGVFVADGSQTIYGSGISHQGQPIISNQSVVAHQQPMVNYGNAAPEIVYYDQYNGYPVQGQTYSPQGQYYENYSPSVESGLVPTPATEQNFGSSLRSSQSVSETNDGYYPSPVEQSDSADPFNEDPQELPEPSLDLDDDQSRFDLEIDDIHEIGHEIKIDLSSTVTEVVINKSISQGKNIDSEPGDDGIELLIQPKDATGKVVEEAGNLTVSLVDSAADQGQRQIGDWTFLKEEAELFFAVDEMDNRGILLNLKWDKLIPVNKRLTVYVRFETNDGRVMETTSDLFIDPPQDVTIFDDRDDESKFISVKQDQGWYKSQSSRGQDAFDEYDLSGQSDRDSNWGQAINKSSNLNFGRSQAQPQFQRQPQWRPAR